MVLPSSPSTNSQHHHTEICTGTLQSTSLWLSRDEEAPSSEATAHFLPRGLGSKERMRRPRGRSYQTSPFCVPNGKEVAVIKKRPSLIAYLENSANSLLSFFSPHERVT